MITVNNNIFVSTEEWKQTVTLAVYSHKLCSILSLQFLKYDYRNQGNTRTRGRAGASPDPVVSLRKMRWYLLARHSHLADESSCSCMWCQSNLPL